MLEYITNIRKKIGHDRLFTIKVDLLENNALPRLSSMEEHYVATAN